MSVPSLTPPECDLRDFPRMMIDITRLRQSAFDATPDDSAWRAGLNLWFSAWHSVPAGSLDNDEPALTKAAGLGRDVRTWRKVKAAALRGFVLCDDGRLYHETVCELALEAWIEKLVQRLSSGAGNAKRWGSVFDPSETEGAIDRAVALLAAIAPNSKSLPKARRRHSKPDNGGSPDGTENRSHRDNEHVPSGSQGTETGTGTKEKNPQKPPEGAFSPSFDLAWGAYPLDGRATTNRAESWDAWQVEAETVGEETLLATVRDFADSVRGKGDRAKASPKFHVWLKSRRYEAFLPKAKAGGTPTAWAGPADVFDAVRNAKRDDTWAIFHLSRCRWDAETRTLTADKVSAMLLRQEAEASLRAIGVRILAEDGIAA